MALASLNDQKRGHSMMSSQYKIVDLTKLRPYRGRRADPPFELDYRLITYRDELRSLLEGIKNEGTRTVRAFSGKTPKKVERQEAEASQLLFRAYHAHFLDVDTFAKHEPYRRYTFPPDTDPAEVYGLLNDMSSGEGYVSKIRKRPAKRRAPGGQSGSISPTR